MAIIHWLGAGLSSAPGIKRLINNGRELWLWNRTVSKAEAVIQHLEGQCQARMLDWQQLHENVSMPQLASRRDGGRMSIAAVHIRRRAMTHASSPSAVTA